MTNETTTSFEQLWANLYALAEPRADNAPELEADEDAAIRTILNGLDAHGVRDYWTRRVGMALTERWDRASRINHVGTALSQMLDEGII